MSSSIPIIDVGVSGVDMQKNPFLLGRGKMAYANNVIFEAREAQTRFPINYHDLGLQGRLQASELVNLGKGISQGVFALDRELLILVVDGKAYYISADRAYGNSKCEGTSSQQPRFCKPQRICDLDFGCDIEVKIAQVESYIIFYGPEMKTHVWDGKDCFVSKGLENRCLTPIADQKGEEPESFCRENLKNWIPHNICRLEYVHGRIHAEVDGVILVGDMIHKRGNNTPEDVLSFNEASHDSFGDPLGWSSKMGSSYALKTYPAMNTVHGEGELINYTYGGILSHKTHIAPRQTKYSAKGEIIQKGWQFERMTVHLTNTVTAVGENAVTVLPRDHFFASAYGVHFLSQVIGEGVMNDESTRTVSQPIEPLMNIDNELILHGRATGHWLRGDRYFCTIGLKYTDSHAYPSAVGFVSFNQSVIFTEDRTPIPSWEGVMTLDGGIEGIHKFISTTVRPTHGSYGFLASDKSNKLYFGELIHDEARTTDYRDGKEIPIKSVLETGKFISASLTKKTDIDTGRIHFIVDSPDTKISIYIRTAENTCWEKWRTVTSCDKDYRTMSEVPIGKPPEGYRNATWYQLRIESDGYFDNLRFFLYGSMGEELKDKTICKNAGERKRNWRKELCLPESIDYNKLNKGVRFCVECNSSLKLEEVCSCANK